MLPVWAVPCPRRVVAAADPRWKGSPVPDPVEYAGAFRAVSEAAREGITAYGEAVTVAAIGASLLKWPDRDIEGTLMAGAWHVGALNVPACPPGPGGAVPLDDCVDGTHAQDHLETASAYAAVITQADAALDSLIAAMGGRGTAARLATSYEQACEKGRQWARELPAGTRRDTLAGMLAAASRRVAFTALGVYDLGTGNVKRPAAGQETPAEPPSAPRRRRPAAGELGWPGPRHLNTAPEVPEIGG